jgi:hypothetical protein
VNIGTVSTLDDAVAAVNPAEPASGAPSPALRTWFGHAPVRWLEFRKQYAGELTANEAGVCQLARLAATGPVTLLYAARDDAHNHALVLADYMRKFPPRHPPRHNSDSA